MRAQSCGKRNGAPRLYGDGIRSSGDVASGKTIGQGVDLSLDLLDEACST